jgi:putative (di)nucleoside polyphosphate hydrolase
MRRPLNVSAAGVLKGGAGSLTRPTFQSFTCSLIGNRIAPGFMKLDAAASLYRPNVAAIVQAQDGKILICERVDVAGAWQFPQGGLHPGESPEKGLPREIQEELSLSPEDYRVCEPRGPYRYLFPADRTKQGYRGQEQYYFRLELLCSPSRVNVATDKPEFRAARWIFPAEFRLSWLPEMRRAVYTQVFRDFFGVTLS